MNSFIRSKILSNTTFCVAPYGFEEMATIFEEITPKHHNDKPLVVNGVELDVFTVIYLTAALQFGSLNPEGEPACDLPPEAYGYSLSDFDVSSLTYAVKCCRSFIGDCKATGCLKGYPYRQAGINFFLSRAGLPNVFAERDLMWVTSKDRAELVKIARYYGSVCLHESDGRLFLVLGRNPS
jgi:hypothetical protein